MISIRQKSPMTRFPASQLRWARFFVLPIVSQIFYADTSRPYLYFESRFHELEYGPSLLNSFAAFLLLLNNIAQEQSKLRVIIEKGNRTPQERKPVAPSTARESSKTIIIHTYTARRGHHPQLADEMRMYDPRMRG